MALLKQYYLSVEVILTQEGFSFGASMLLEKNGKQLRIVENKAQFDPNAYQEKGYPVILNIQGKGLLVKSFPSNRQPLEDAFNIFFPGSPIDDFFIQSIDTAQARWMGMIRKTLMSPVIEALQSKGYFITQMTLSPLSLVYLGTFYAQAQNLSLEQYTASFEEGQLQILSEGSTTETEILYLGEFTIPKIYILCFASAWGSITQSKLIEEVTYDTLTQQQENYSYKERIKKMITLAGVVGLCILLVNTLLNLTFQQKEEVLSQTLSQYTSIVSEEEQMQKDWTVLSTTVQPISRTSFYADRITASMLPALHLKSLKIFPFEDEQMQDSLDFKPQIIEIKGNADNAETFNQWINDLRKADWIEAIEQQQFTKEVSKTLGTFNLTLRVR